MNRMKALFVIMVLAVVGFGGTCDSVTEACGPCGKVSTGDATISGDAQLDGFFKAVGTLGTATATIKGNFRAQVEELAALFNIEGAAEMELPDLVAAVKAEIEGQIAANVDGGLTIQYKAPACSANVSVAVDAQAKCEAKGGCDAKCDPGSVKVKCEGSCSGGCSGGCSGKMECSVDVDVDGKCGGSCEGTCEVEGPSVACSGSCNGTCTVEAGVQCTGTCEGNCTGKCDGNDVDGVACTGKCDGQCDAKCNIQGAAKCEGSCNGKCEATPPEGKCEGSCKGECKVEATADVKCKGEAKCDAECTGECSGGCEGKATPPSCSANCDASAKCEAQASAQASASLECTPPSLEIAFNLNASLEADAKAKAEFLAKMEGFRLKMIGIIQGMAQMRALVDANYAAELGIECPLVAITGQVKALVKADLGSYDIPAGLLPCVIPAFEDAVTILGSVASDTKTTVEGQLSLFAVLKVG
ncbi:MAG: hypothetical protein PHU25_01915 [Deltaproteobacteria bacterium]|nr:hypothetical protein [Deltaproteobacteria bacterium]